MHKKTQFTTPVDSNTSFFYLIKEKHKKRYNTIASEIRKCILAIASILPTLYPEDHEATPWIFLNYYCIRGQWSRSLYDVNT